MDIIKSMIRKNLSNILTYEPVEPISLIANKFGIDEDQIIKLNGNENPYGPSPKIIDAIKRSEISIYPDPFQRNLRQELEKFLKINSDHIIGGAGSDELIDLLFKLFISPGDLVLDCDPTFGMYSFCARVAGAKVEKIPRNSNFDLDINAIRASTSRNPKIIFISSPNNPTGNICKIDEIKALLDLNILVVVDEAYYEFNGFSVANLVPEFDNLVVLRTFSKWAGLAGLRIGYGIMPKNIVLHLLDIKSPYNVSTTAESAAIASLNDSAYLFENVEKIKNGKKYLFNKLNDIDGISPYPSAANFVLFNLINSKKAIEIYNKLRSKGILIRKFNNVRLEKCLRVSVGTDPHNTTFINTLMDIM
ncbi:MAG: histidinol-phosphate transaminase [SAR202 cluster bacterium]|nr:histidinol-phosphate transaminase [SAR202 cluster bacterium]|tara:strand:+ start:6884 stop:7969 length:1086 start_codon:yes stop_codon:yes gene_type:complete